MQVCPKLINNKSFAVQKRFSVKFAGDYRRNVKTHVIYLTIENCSENKECLRTISSARTLKSNLVQFTFVYFFAKFSVCK